jgi:DNA-binding response OmpR family regulator
MALVLIVEDEKVLAEMYRDKFEQEGFKADLVFSSEDAIEYLKNKKPDLILLDILLPKANGISFLEKIKELKETIGEIPVVAFSNYDDLETRNRAILLGAKDYLLKTQYTPTELVKRVKELLKK